LIGGRRKLLTEEERAMTSKHASVFLFLVALFLMTAPVQIADDGVWTFDNPPRKIWKERYNFEPDEGWLEHVRLASIRMNDGGSAAFVSPHGLVLTNQHVASGQLQKVSTAERNYTRDGFIARNTQDELRCPDAEINVLVSYEEVTRRVQSAVKAASADKEANEQRKAEISKIERESNEKTGLRSEVVTLYSGGEYWLYRFKRYTDVRLVFAPEEQIAFFGGDFDNFTFPRHDLDFAFFRVYENGQPANTPHYLKWSARGAEEGDFVVVSGNPGSTNRLLTLAQLRYQRDVGNPLQMQVWTLRREALIRYAARNEEAARRASAQRRSLENSIKRLIGQQEGLQNPRMIGKKEEEEKALLAELAKRPDLQRMYGGAWEHIAAAYRELPKMATRQAFSTLAPFRLGTIGSTLVRYAEETAKPNDQRYEEFRDSKLDSLRFSLLSPAPIYADMEEALLAEWLEGARKTLGDNDPFIKAALAGATAVEASRKAVAGTRLADVGFRKSLLEKGAVSSSQDPMIILARTVEPVIRELRSWQEDRIKSVEAGAGEKIAQARFAVYGKTIYPDATFSLRLSFGVVSAYEEDTTWVPYKTTFYGLYDRAASFNEKPPYHLPARYREGRNLLELSTPLNFVYTADTIGGNSGSPVINRNAELVGLNFDSNVQKLPNRYMYIDEKEGARAIGVHSAAILEVLRKLYNAVELIHEIAGN
jgi:hypothetical protein